MQQMSLYLNGKGKRHCKMEQEKNQFFCNGLLWHTMFILNFNDNFKLKIFVIGNHLAKFEYNLVFHLGEWSHCHVNFFPT